MGGAGGAAGEQSVTRARATTNLARLVAVVLALGVAVSVAFVTASAAEAKKRSASYLLKSLRVAAENPSGYDRSLFPHWIVIKDGCDTREVVLIRQARSGPSVGAGCRVGSGRWFSPFDGVTVRDPGELDIDHLVALSEAWASGARGWSTDRRRAFANDVSYRRSLIAVTASSNRSKGDQDPAEWLPPRTSYRCTYIKDWIAVKYRWRLSVDAQERAALTVLVNGCGNPRITVPPRPR